MKVSAPALFLCERFILGPCCVTFAGAGLWGLLIRHWSSAALLLAAALGMALLARDLLQRERKLQQETPEGFPGESGEDEIEQDDSQDLASAIVRSNVLLCVLLAGLIWSEHFPMIRSAVFVVLFSILYPAAAALFCLVGERMLRGRESDPPTLSGNLPPWRGAPRPH